jgi:hypothetical protein
MTRRSRVNGKVIRTGEDVCVTRKQSSRCSEKYRAMRKKFLRADANNDSFHITNIAETTVPQANLAHRCA